MFLLPVLINLMLNKSINDYFIKKILYVFPQPWQAQLDQTVDDWKLQEPFVIQPNWIWFSLISIPVNLVEFIMFYCSLLIRMPSHMFQQLFILL